MGDREIRSVYFLGIGGIGMSALARYFLQQDVRVAGYDRTPTPLTDQLIREGMAIHFREDPSHIPEGVDLVIRTPAVPLPNTEYRHFEEQGIPILKRAEMLGRITVPFYTIAVAGTHGKTTTSTLIAHLFLAAGRPVLAFLGGISKNYGTNFLWAQGHKGTRAQRHKGTGAQTHKLTTSPPHHLTTCIVEADEYDRSFLHLSPDLAIITSIDPDHLDIYANQDQMRKSFGEFAERIRTGGHLILKKGVQIQAKVPEKVTAYSYALDEVADFYPTRIVIRENKIRFDLGTPAGILKDLELGIPGLFNLENTVAALAAGWLSEIREEELRRGLKSFQGVVRRFDFRIRRDDLVYIDDYAHHPEELRACIRAVKELFPGRRITGVFQPHLYSRTRDLAADFARALAELDSLILLDIYPAREKPIEGVSSEMLLEQINLSDKQICRKENLLELLENHRPEVLLTLGAGDIDQLVLPITERLGMTGRTIELP